MTEALIIGGERLPLAEEKALNLMLLKYGGQEQGQQLYKLEWGAESNSGRKIPLCFHENQMSYHLLSWEPPRTQAFDAELGEDTSRGTYACLFHFIDTETGKPMKPTQTLMEIIIPVLLDLHEIARAAQKGFTAELANLRMKRERREAEKEAAKERAFDTAAEAMLTDALPFYGQPHAGPGGKGVQVADLTMADAMRREATFAPPNRGQFVFSVRPNKGGRRGETG